MDWKGANVVITGASRGIGKAVALAAARKGATLGLIARTEADLKDVLAEAGGRGSLAVADVGDPAALAQAISALESELGPTDILVANAGVGFYGAFADITAEEIDTVVRTNIVGTATAMRAVVPGMIERRRGHIVTVASIGGRIGAPFESIYSATKAAGVALTEALSVELSPYGVGVSMVNPGAVITNFGEARGHPYDRNRPKPIPAERVADTVIKAVEGDRLESYVPGFLRGAVVARHLLPPIYRVGTKRAFKKELARDREQRGR